MTYSYVKRSAEVPFGSSRYGFGKGGVGRSRSPSYAYQKRASADILDAGVPPLRMDEKEKSREGRNVR